MTDKTETLKEIQARTDLDKRTVQKFMNHRHPIPFAIGTDFFWYTPIDPVADNDDLAKKRRLILYHARHDGPVLFVAQPGDLVAGWVVGVGD